MSFIPLHTPPTSHPSQLTPLPTHTPLLQDFIIDLETFESQKAELIGQLESTLHPLTQFPQENPTQLHRTTEKLKQGYETVTEKVCHPSHPHHPHHPHIFPPSHPHTHNHPHTLPRVLTRPFPKGTVPLGGSNVPFGSAPKPTMCPLAPPQNQLILAAT